MSALQVASGQVQFASSGQAVITNASGLNYVEVAMPSITASSLIVLTVSQDAPDATAINPSVYLNAGVGFLIFADDVAAADVPVNWAVLKY